MERELIGRFAVSGAGRDKACKYVIVHTDEKYLYLCDGKYHPLEKVKKKAYKHVEICAQSVEPQLRRRITNKEKVFDHEIKYAIKNQQEGKEEGYVKK